MTEVEKKIKTILEQGFDDFKQGQTFYEDTIPAILQLIQEEKVRLIDKIQDRAWYHLDETDDNGDLPIGIGWNKKADDMVDYLEKLKQSLKDKDKE